MSSPSADPGDDASAGAFALEPDLDLRRGARVAARMLVVEAFE
jgi:hypothetical protein